MLGNAMFSNCGLVRIVHDASATTLCLDFGGITLDEQDAMFDQLNLSSSRDQWAEFSAWLISTVIQINPLTVCTRSVVGRRVTVVVTSLDDAELQQLVGNILCEVTGRLGLQAQIYI